MIRNINNLPAFSGWARQVIASSILASSGLVACGGDDNAGGGAGKADAGKDAATVQGGSGGMGKGGTGGTVGSGGSTGGQTTGGTAGEAGASGGGGMAGAAGDSSGGTGGATGGAGGTTGGSGGTTTAGGAGGTTGGSGGTTGGSGGTTGGSGGTTGGSGGTTGGYGGTGGTISGGGTTAGGSGGTTGGSGGTTGGSGGTTGGSGGTTGGSGGTTGGGTGGTISGGGSGGTTGGSGGTTGGSGGTGGTTGGTGGTGGGTTGPSWMAYRADPVTDLLNELYGVDVSAGTPSAPVKLNAALTDANMDVDGFTWSPDGNRMTFEADQQTYLVDELFLLDMTTKTPGAPVRLNGALVANGDVINHAWSPDSMRVAYRADQDTDLVDELYVVNVSGSTPSASVKVSGTMATSGDIISYRWSPDGKWLVYEADQDTDLVEELYVVSFATGTPSAPVKISGTMVTNGDIVSYQWSPDSTRIAFEADKDTDAVEELYVVAMGAGTPSPVKVSGTMVTNGDIVSYGWSPDGTRIAFEADQEVDLQEDLYVVTFSGNTPGTPVKVTGTMITNGDVWEWGWAPNSQWITFEADKDTDAVEELYAVSTATATPATAIKIATMPTAGDLSGAHVWSPDSKWLAFRADTETDEVYELFLINMSGVAPGAPLKVSGTLVVNGDVSFEEYSFAPNATGLVYIADQDVDVENELFFVSLVGATPAAPKQVNAPLVTAGDVQDWAWSSDSTTVAYRADQDVDLMNELYMSVVSSGTPTVAVKLSGPMAGTTNGVLTPYSWQP